jgi:hypothetical protein
LSYLQETIEIFSSSVSEGNDMIASHGPDQSSSVLKEKFAKTGSFVASSLRMVQERMALSMRSWASCQLSQNKQAISKLGGRVRGHWRGDLSLFQIYFYCPVLAFLFLVILFGAVLTAEAAFEMSAVKRAYLEATGIAGIGACGLWWCVGAFRKTNNLLSENRMAIATIVYVTACWTSWQVGWFFFPEALDSIGTLSKRIEEEREYLADLQEGNKKQPWLVTAQPELRRIIAEGRIGHGSADALEKVVRQYPELRLVELNSKGGYVSEMNKLVAIVESNHLDTFVREKCASACTDIFLAGERRYVDHDARFGFHQSGYKGRPRDTEWSITEYMTSIDFRAKGLPEPFISKALNTSYYDLWRPDVLELKASGFATAWWSDRGPEYR